MKNYRKIILIIFGLFILSFAWNLTQRKTVEKIITNDKPAEELIIEEVAPNSNGIPTSADNSPPGSIHNLPVPEAVAAVKLYVAEKEGVDLGLVLVTTAYEAEWSDSCLGLGGPAESCLTVITPGYEITVQVKGKAHKYRTNLDGSIIRREY